MRDDEWVLAMADTAVESEEERAQVAVHWPLNEG